MLSIDRYIDLIVSLSNQDKLPLVISLQNTVSSSMDKNSLFFLPIRNFKGYLFTGICNANNDETRYFLEKAQKFAKYIFRH